MTAQWLTGALLVVGVPLVLGAWWLRTHPNGPCPRCKGRGTNWFSTRWRSGVCPRCGGSRQERKWP